jgi:hypothetical protein
MMTHLPPISGPVTTLDPPRPTWPGEWSVRSSAPVGVAPRGLLDPPYRTPRPAAGARPTPRLPRSLRNVRAWTGWSNRELAEAIGSTHPTVDAVLQGRATLARQPAQVERIFALHALLERLRVVVDGDRAELTRAVRTASDGRPSALAILEEGELPGAYLAALDVLRPPRTVGMMQGRYPRRPGDAACALNDE